MYPFPRGGGGGGGGSGGGGGGGGNGGLSQNGLDQHLFVVDLVKEVTSGIQLLWGESELSDIDVKFVFPDEACKTFHLHKFLLRNSEFFSASLSGPWRGCDKRTIQVAVEDPLSDLASIEAVLQGLYGYRIEINESDVLNLIAAASFLGVPRVYNECRRFIEREVDLVNVARFCNFAANSAYPVSEAIVRRCVKYLNVRAFDDARELLPELPLGVLKRLFLSPGLWVPSEMDKFNLIMETFLTKSVGIESRGGENPGSVGVGGGAGGTEDSARGAECDDGRDLILWFDGREVKFGSDLGALTSTLRSVLCNGIQYMHVTDWDFVELRKQLRVPLNPCFAPVLEKHSYNQKVLLTGLQKIQVRDYGDEDVKVRDVDQLSGTDEWFYFGAELADAIGFLESRKRQPSEETDRIHYGGSDWSVGFIREKDRGSSKLGVVLRRWEAAPDRATKFGFFYDMRQVVRVEMKLFVDDIVREGVSTIGMGNCYVFSGVVSRETLGNFLVTYDDDFRVTVGLRLT